MATHFGDLARTILRRSRPSGLAADPFASLGIQWRLRRVAAEIRHLEQDDGRWARVHHLRAAELAYDDLLAEACRLAGIPVPDAPRPVRRLIMEGDLRTRGWTW